VSARRRAVAVALVCTVLAVSLVSCRSGSDQVRSSSTPSSRATRSTTTTTTPVTTTSPTTTTVPPQGPVANPWPAIGTPPSGHHAILAMGDSIMGQTVHSLPAVLASHGFDAVVYDAHANASGLLDPMNGMTARELLAQQLALHPDVDTVLFEWLNVCAFACADGDPAYGSPAFYTAWQDAARALVADARAHGLQVLWAIPPPPPPPTTTEPLAESWDNRPMRAQVATQLANMVRQYPLTLGVSTADWWTALSDTNGSYQQTLWYDDALHQVRSDDGVHLTEDGSVRTSTWTVASLVQISSP
jgi:hypothetical protein